MLLSIVLFGGRCRKEGSKCHYSIQLKNNSNDNLAFGTRYVNPEGKCKLSGTIIESGNKFDYRPYNICIEDRLKGNSYIGIYIIDLSMYNDPTVYYDCDSITDYNLILAHHKLTIEDLRAIDFTINYP